MLENLATDFSKVEKKAWAMQFVGDFYDRVFSYVDLPVIPNFVEPLIHKYVKGVLMIMVDASIDAAVTMFKNTGVFLKQSINGEK